MRIFLITLILAMSSFAADAQYTLYKEVDGLKIYTKWGYEKWWSKKGDKVLMVKIENTRDVAISTEIGIEFFKDLVMVEESPASAACIPAGKSLKPRMKNGFMFKPITRKSSEMDTFEITLSDIKLRDRKDCK